MGGSLATTNDYSEAGLLGPISSEEWVQFWARTRAEKWGGGSELHATLIKVAVEEVFTQMVGGSLATIEGYLKATVRLGCWAISSEEWVQFQARARA